MLEQEVNKSIAAVNLNGQDQDVEINITTTPKPIRNNFINGSEKMNDEFNKAVTNFLRSICSIFVVKNGGLVLHASGILRDGKAYIFFGPSGSGKSTVANLSPNFIVLDDESIFIERIRDCYQASGRKLKGNFPIQGLYRLIKDKKVYLEKLPLSRALGELFTVPGLLKGLAWHERLLANFSNLVMEIQCFDLHFRRDSSFWSYIDEHIK